MDKQSPFYTPVTKEIGIAAIRVMVGLILVYHGCEILDPVKMDEYSGWEAFKGYFSPKLVVYLGKGAELLSGILLTLGFLTRLASTVVVFTFLYITFFVGKGKFWYEDQHPFLFVLLALVFFFAGAGRYSIDHFLFNKTTSQVVLLLLLFASQF